METHRAYSSLRRVLSFLLLSGFCWALPVVVVGFSPAFEPVECGGPTHASFTYDEASAAIYDYDAVGVLTTASEELRIAGQGHPFFELADFLAAKTTVAPRFLVTESGVAVPTEAAELEANMKLLQETSTSPATARKFLGTDSQGPLRVRIEQAHPSTPGYTGPIDPLHTVDHLHIDRRLNGTTGPWRSNEKLPYGWPF